MQTVTQTEMVYHNNTRTEVLNLKKNGMIGSKSKMKMWPFDKETCIKNHNLAKSEKKKYKLEIVWLNVTVFSLLHVFTIYGLYLMVAENRYKIFAFNYIMGHMLGQGISGGAHRLWAHRSYKAKLPMRLCLLALQTAMFQNSVFVWVRDHRLHHKYTDTDADPHNAKRGFFFSHIGWLLCRKHPEVIEKGRTIDLSDLKRDKLVMWQHRNYMTLMPLFAFVIPTLMVQKIFAESLFISFLYGGIVRYTISVNYTWLVNSAAHLWGMKPYDKTIGPVENKVVSFLTTGEGWHNYHHVFPWDYKAAELGNYSLNLTLALINLCAKIGWAYDMKTVSPTIIHRRIQRTGDGSWKGKFDGDDENNNACDNTSDDSGVNSHLWGWGDKEMDPVEMKLAEIHNRKR